MNARSESVARLSLRPKEAAAALGISTRTLWALTSPRGPIKCVRCIRHGAGTRRAVLYAVESLNAFLADESAASEERSI